MQKIDTRFDNITAIIVEQLQQLHADREKADATKTSNIFANTAYLRLQAKIELLQKILLNYSKTLDEKIYIHASCYIITETELKEKFDENLDEFKHLNGPDYDFEQFMSDECETGDVLTLIK